MSVKGTPLSQFEKDYIRSNASIKTANTIAKDLKRKCIGVINFARANDIIFVGDEKFFQLWKPKDEVERLAFCLPWR